MPINSVELRRVSRYSGRLERFVQLTKVNRECLVLHSPSIDGDVEVLFCGDSPLGDGPGYRNTFLANMEFRWPLVITAPHHGADTNAIAYRHLGGVVDHAYWVRSGGKPDHPGKTYRSLPSSNRACTRCPHRKYRAQVASITDYWPARPHIAVRSYDCNC